MSNINQVTNDSKENKYAIKVEETLPFDATLKSQYITTLDLCKIINGLFRPVFADYEACMTYIDPNGNVQVDPYFKEHGTVNGKQKNIKPFNQKNNNNDIMARLRSVSNNNTGRNIDLTDETKEALSEFMIGPYNNNKVNWSQCVFEITERSYNGYSVYLKVRAVDVYKIIKKVFGNTNEEGNYVDYKIDIIKPTGMMISGATNNFLLTITQLDTKMVEELYKEIGMIPSQGTIPMVRDC